MGLGETVQKRLKSHGTSPGITTAEILQTRRANRMKAEDGEDREESCREEEDESQDIGTQTESKFAEDTTTMLEATCKLCKQANVSTSYIGETGNSAYSNASNIWKL